MTSFRHSPARLLAPLLFAIATSYAVAQEAAVATDAAAATQVTLTPEAVDRYGVTVDRAQARALSQPIIAPAWVAFNPDRMAQVGTVVDGRVTKLHVGVGDAVRAGDPLVEILSSELGRAQSEFLQRRAQVAVVKAAAGAAEMNHQRAITLAAEKAIPPAELQRREVEFQKAQTDILAAEAELLAAENQLALMGMEAPAREELARTKQVSPRLTISAPIAGTVTERAVTQGQVVGPDEESLFTIADPASLWVLVNVPEGQAWLVDKGDSATVSSPALGGRTLKTSVTNVAPVVNAKTRTVQVRIAVDGNPALKPGAFAQVEITPNGKRSAVVVPRDAVFVINSTPVVFVPNGSPGSFTARDVEVAAAVGDVVPVTDGLAEGDLVVVKGGVILKAEIGKSGAKGCTDCH